MLFITLYFVFCLSTKNHVTSGKPALIISNFNLITKKRLFIFPFCMGTRVLKLKKSRNRLCNLFFFFISFWSCNKSYFFLDLEEHVLFFFLTCDCVIGGWKYFHARLCVFYLLKVTRYCDGQHWFFFFLTLGDGK